MNSAFIRTESLTRVYKNGRDHELFGLKNINLEIAKGEFLAIMGPSGAGKTTLFNLLGLLDRPDYGSLYHNNIDIKDMSAAGKAAFRNRHVGLIFQQFYLVPNLTVSENVVLPILLGRRPPAPGQGLRVESLLEQFGMIPKKDYFPNQLSGGELQRAAIVRALVNDPQVILADEPTGNLDSWNAGKIIDFLAGLSHHQGRTVVLVTHNRELAAKAGRIIFLKDGEIDHEETP